MRVGSFQKSRRAMRVVDAAAVAIACAESHADLPLRRANDQHSLAQRSASQSHLLADHYDLLSRDVAEVVQVRRVADPPAARDEGVCAEKGGNKRLVESARTHAEVVKAS